MTSGVDATLYTLQRFLGRDAALETVRRVGYPHTGYLDDPSWRLPGDNPAAVFGDRLLVPNAFRWERTDVGLFVHPGVREIELSSGDRHLPAVHLNRRAHIAAERGLLRTRHGLDLRPPVRSGVGLASAPRLDRILVPGQSDTALSASLERFATAQDRPVERIHADGGYPYDVTFTDMARQETRLVAEYAARWLEYPVTGLELRDRDWSLALLLRMAAVGGLGVLVWHGIRRALRLRRTV